MTTPLQAFKAHMNITDDADDVALKQALETATAWVECAIGGTIEPEPAPVARAARMLAGHLFEHREATISGVTTQELPFGVWDLLEPYRRWY